MDQENKDSKFSQQKNLTASRSQKLDELKQQVNVQDAKFTAAQKEIEQMKVILTDARRRLEVMKRRNVTK